MKFFSLLLIPFLTIAAFANAAGPLMHQILAEKWVNANEQYHESEVKEFIIGALFPDIRYLGVIARNQTHEQGLNASSLKEPASPFKKGMRHHALLDEVREQYVEQWNIYSELTSIPAQYRATFLKLIEDEILYQTHRFDSAALEEIVSEELNWGIAPSDIEKWHQYLKIYFSMPPSHLILLAASANREVFGVPAEELRYWIALLPSFAESKLMKEYVERLVETVESQMD